MLEELAEEEPIISGFKKNTDGSTTFKMHKGPYDKHKVRVYGSFDRAIYSHPVLGVVVYVLHPPVRKGGKWVYAYDENDKTPQTDAERGAVDWSDAAQLNWLAHGRWKRADDARRLSLLEERRSA